MSHIRPRGNSYLLGLFLRSDVDDWGLDVYEFRVYAHLCRRAGDELRVCEAKKKIAAICRMSERKVRETVQALEEKGWLAREANYREDGTQTTNNIRLLGIPDQSVPVPSVSSSIEEGTPPGTTCSVPRQEVPGPPAHGAGLKYIQEKNIQEEGKEIPVVTAVAPPPSPDLPVAVDVEVKKAAPGPKGGEPVSGGPDVRATQDLGSA